MSTEAEQLEPVHLFRVAAPLRRLTVVAGLAAVLVGAASALAAGLVRLGFLGLQWVFTHSVAPPPVAAAHLPPWRRVLTPVIGGLLATLVLVLRKERAHRLGREPRPYEEYVEAVRHRHGIIPLVPNCWRTLSAAFSVATGAAVGREGSMIQFASATASAMGGWFNRRLSAAKQLDLSLLVAFGVAGGVTTAYNAPVAGVCFAAEIVLGGFDLHQLPLLGLAAASGWLVSGMLLGWQRLYPTHVALLAHPAMLGALPLLAALFGLLGPAYQRLLRSLRVGRRLPLALACSGLLVGVASLRDPRVWGNGDLGLSAALGRAELPGLSIGVAALALLLLLRLLATTACVGTGAVGGVFTPTLFAGGAAGALLGHGAMHVASSADPTLWAIAGMSCLLAAVTHAPFMATFVTVELTGDWPLLPLLLALNEIAFRLARRLSGHALYAIASQAPAEVSGQGREGH